MANPPLLEEPVETKEAAQRRVDRIDAFRRELDDLERLDVLVLTEQQREAVRRHHAGLLNQLAARFDVDRTEAQRTLSLGMKIVALLGAAALAAAVFSFFARFWGVLPAPAQVAVLAGAPLLAVAGLELAARKDRSMYFAGILGILAVTCFIIDLSMLGSIFNVRATPAAFLAWGTFAAVLAYLYGLRLLLVAAMITFAVFFASQFPSWQARDWVSFGERPENFFLPGVLALAVPIVLPHRRLPSFPPIYRFAGFFAILMPILILANWGAISYLPFSTARVEVSYQIVGFAACVIAIAWGVRRQFTEVVNLAAAFFVALLFTKFVDWWWDWLPRWVFFLVVGAVAILALAFLRRLHAVSKKTS